MYKVCLCKWLCSVEFVSCVAVVFYIVQAVQFLASCMANSKVIDVSVAREILSVCSHLARSSDDHIPLLIHIFEGPQSQFWPLVLTKWNTKRHIMSYFISNFRVQKPSNIACLVGLAPHGAGAPLFLRFLPCPFTSSSFALFYFSLFSLAFLTIFFFCPSLLFLPE